jgi:hypothetical protein
MKRIALAAVFAAFLIPASAQVKDRAVAVQETEAVVTVTKVDRQARTVTFRGPKGGVATLAIPPDAKNFDKVSPGQQYRMKYVEAVAFEIRKGGKPSSAAEQRVALAPKGANPGGMIVRAQQIAGVVEGIDYTSRYVAVRGPKGNIASLKVADDVPLGEITAGDRISVTYTDALAIEMVEKPAKAR